MHPLLPLGFVSVIVPPFSRSVRIQRNPDNTPVRLEFCDGGGHLYRVVSLPVNDEGPVPVDAACAYIIVYNMAPIPIATAQAVFDVTPT
jgi:hypothetical protein